MLVVISFMICEWIILECAGNVKLLFFTIHKIFRIRASSTKPLTSSGSNHSLHLDNTHLCQPSVPLQSELPALSCINLSHHLRSALLEKQKFISTFHTGIGNSSPLKQHLNYFENFTFLHIFLDQRLFLTVFSLFIGSATPPAPLRPFLVKFNYKLWSG